MCHSITTVNSLDHRHPLLAECRVHNVVDLQYKYYSTCTRVLLEIHKECILIKYSEYSTLYSSDAPIDPGTCGNYYRNHCTVTASPSN
jgi:hypothetical protein